MEKGTMSAKCKIIKFPGGHKPPSIEELIESYIQTNLPNAKFPDVLKKAAELNQTLAAEIQTGSPFPISRLGEWFIYNLVIQMNLDSRGLDFKVVNESALRILMDSFGGDIA